MKTNRLSSLTLVGAAAVFALHTNVHAQDALGAGNVLDGNLGVGTGGVNAPASAPNFRERNLIVTGDVIGGRGFRGSVGYTAESDFRGVLGSNELFQFRAASAISSPPLFQMGSTYERLRFGYDLGLIEYRRAGSGDPATLQAQNPIVIMDPQSRAQLDRRIISTSTALAPQQVVEPQIVGAAYANDGSLLLIQASPVRGLTVEPMGQSIGMIGLGTYDAARVREDIGEGRRPSTLGAQFDLRFEHLLDLDTADDRDTGDLPEPPAGDFSLQRDSRTGPQRIDTNLQPDYSQVLQRVAERYARSEDVESEISPDLLSQMDREYQALREQLIGRTGRQGEIDRSVDRARRPAEDREAIAAAPDAGILTPDETDFTRPFEERERDPATGLLLEREETRVPPLASDFAAALRHGQQIDRLSGPTQDRFNELLSSAEARLRDGEYFVAERRFERALRFAPGHPMATIGLAHSQIGAGLYLSASLTLRGLLADRPEMIDVTYSPDLLPAPERLEAAIESVRRRIEDANENDIAPYGFLIAYIGHQSRDRDLVDEGLNIMAQAEPDHPMIPLLREVWQSEEEPATPEK